MEEGFDLDLDIDSIMDLLFDEDVIDLEGRFYCSPSFLSPKHFLKKYNDVPDEICEALKLIQGKKKIK